MKSKGFTVFRDTQGKLKQNFLSIIITLFVIGVLVFSGPAQAVTLAITAIDGTSPNENTDVSFQVSADIAPGERVPVRYLRLDIGSDDCTFYPNGTEIGGSLCDTIIIVKDTPGVPYGYGAGANMYGYGFGYNSTADENGYYNTSFGAGYGFGYDGSVADEFLYNITWTTPGVVSDQDYDVSFSAYANNTAGGDEFLYSETETDFFTVMNADSTPPVITLVGANPQVIEVGDSYTELGATALDDNDGNLTGSIVIDASSVDTGTIGSYTVYYDVTDSSSNPATQVTRTVNVVDTTDPVVTITSPADSAIVASSKTIVFNVTEPVSLDKCWWTNNTGTTNTSVSCAGTISQTWHTGANTITVYANDSSGNIGSDTVSFTVDTTAPTTTVTGNRTLAGSYVGNYTSNTWTPYNVTVAFSCSDGSGIGCDKTLYCTENSSCTPTNVWNSSLHYTNYNSAGTHYFRYRSNDTLGNLETTGEFITKIDRTLPVVTIISPSSDGTSSSSNIDIEYSASDTNLDNCWWNTDGSSTGTAINCSTSITDQTWPSGSNTVYVYANDSAGNIGSSSVQFTKTSSSIPSTVGEGVTESEEGGVIVWVNTFVVENIESLLQGYTRQLSEGERIQIRVAGGTHYVGVIVIIGNVVTVQISSTPQKANLRIGESAKFDVNDDGYYDVYVKHNGILPGNKADILVMSIHEKIPPVKPIEPFVKPPVVPPVVTPIPPVCTPDWSCGEWSECVEGNHARVCTDNSNCGTSDGKPAESESCSMPSKPIPPIAGIIAILIVIVFALFTVIYIMRAKENKY